MRCPSCGSENPDHSFYCGRCTAELRNSEPADTERIDARSRPEKSIEDILRMILLRTEENASRRHNRFAGKSEARSRRNLRIGFKSEYEEVTLKADEYGHATVTRGSLPDTPFVLIGSHNDIVHMLESTGSRPTMPSSIRVRHDSLPLPGRVNEEVIRWAAEHHLRTLLGL